MRRAQLFEAIAIASRQLLHLLQLPKRLWRTKTKLPFTTFWLVCIRLCLLSLTMQDTKTWACTFLF